jgi:putative membrane protein
MTTLFATLHHSAVLTLLVCTLVSLYQLRQPLTVPGARLLRRTDMLNGIAATLVLAVGLVRVFYLEKGSAYYFSNGPFLAKLGFYGLASILSLVSTLEIRHWRVPLQQERLPTLSDQKLTAMCTVAYLQLACLAAMATCANLAAHGRAWHFLGSAH